MGRRIPRGASWRLAAALTLLIALAGMFPQGVRAASAIAIAVTDDAGTPLAGAAFGVYTASVDVDGALFIDPAALIGGPVVSDADGLAYLSDLPDGLTVGVSQLAVPAGYRADTASRWFLTTDPAVPGAVAVVNAAAPAPVTATVAVSVTERVSATALDGVTVEVRRVNSATGAPGDVVAATVSDATGSAALTLATGAYVVSVVAPGGYLPADAQPVTVGVPAGGSLAGASLAFGLQPEPTEPIEPTVPPLDPPTVEPTATQTAVPTETAPTATVPADPTATLAPTEPPASTAPSVAPSAGPTETPGSDGSGFVPGQLATIDVFAIVCTSNDPNLIGTLRINPNTDRVSGPDDIPDICRPAHQDEFTFVLRDPRQPSPWDDFSLGMHPTDANGMTTFETVISRDGQQIFLYEQANPNDFQSSPIVLVPNGTVSMLAIEVIGEPRGDVVIRTVDSVSGLPVAGACYDLAAAGALDVPLATACDADDGADGTLTFPATANGEYVVVPGATPPGYVFAPTPLTVSSKPVDLSVPAVPYGTLQLLARSCLVPPAGVVVPTPTPANGDGIDGLDGRTTETLPSDGSEGPIVVFSAVDGSVIDAAGTGLEGATTETGCTAIGASLLVTAPDGTVTTVTVGADGVASPASLPPTSGDGRYTVRDAVSGAETAVAVNPAGTTTVTMVTLANGLGTSPNG